MRILLTHVVREADRDMFDRQRIAYSFVKQLADYELFDHIYVIPGTNAHKALKSTSYDFPVRLIGLRRIPLLSYLQVLIDNLYFVCRVPMHSKVWLCSISGCNVVTFLLLRFFRPRVKTFIFIKDYYPSAATSRYHPIFGLISLAGGAVKLNENNFIHLMNCCSLPSVVPNSRPDSYERLKEISRRFLILDRNYDHTSMLPFILDVFSEMKDCELFITGDTSYGPDITQAIAANPRVHYFKNPSTDEYKRLVENVTFCFSLYQKDQPQYKEGYPPEIIDFLAANRIVISSQSYEQLKDLLYIVVPLENKEFFIQGLKRILHMSDDELFSYANFGKRIEADVFNKKVWEKHLSNIEERSKTINNFFDN